MTSINFGGTSSAQLFAAAAHGNGVQVVRLNAVKQDIARNLDQADLTISKLADRHRCTPRSLQRMFEADGTTFTKYLLLQRLSRARRILADPVRYGEKISTVAYDCGFGDVSYFNRTFRQHYGATPSDIRAQARQRS